MRTVLEILLYIDAALLILAILSQQSGTGMSITFGGSGGDNFFRKKRGVEKLLETLTIIFGVIFILLALIIPFSDKLVSVLGL